jgi:hypothetical protein
VLVLLLLGFTQTFGKDCLRIVTQLINNIYKSGEWRKNFTEVTMTLKKKQKATKCSDHRTNSLIAHTAKIVAWIFKRRIERKIEDIADPFGFGRGKRTVDATGVMIIITERNYRQ